MFKIATATLLAYAGPERVNIVHPRITVDHFMPMPRWFPFPSSLAFRRHEAAWIAASFRPNASGISDVERVWRTEQRCRLLIFRSCPEIEPRVFPHLTDLYRKPAVPAGLLLPDGCDEGDRDDSIGVAQSSDTLRWLDEQPPGSVVYVALGSEAPLTDQSVCELAFGLELAGVRFLWALRRPSGTSSVSLPEGFEARTCGRGVVCTSWVPQVRVLAHAAVGAFLTHCGWGSVVESFRFGHPLVMLPFVIDQGLIARMMAERGVGVEVARRDDDDGSFGREDIAAALRLVMMEEEGKVLTRNAKKLQEEVVGNAGQQERYVDELVDCLRCLAASEGEVAR